MYYNLNVTGIYIQRCTYLGNGGVSMKVYGKKQKVQEQKWVPYVWYHGREECWG